MSRSVDVILNAVKAAGEAALRLHEENAALRAERDRYLKALQRIATTDYRGNRSQESTIAHEALLR